MSDSHVIFGSRLVGTSNNAHAASTSSSDIDGCDNTSTTCLCQLVASKGDTEEVLDSITQPLRCPVCVQQHLKPYKERHAQALKDHAEAKQNCARLLKKHDYHQRLSTLQAESQLLRDRLTTMRKECSDMAVRVATQAIENDRHRTNIGLGPQIEMQQHHLTCFNQQVLEGSIAQAIETATNQVRVLRFQWARKALEMHRLDIDLEDVKLTQLQRRRQQKQPNQIIQRQARGIGKIGGLPLPHAGPELYGVLPPRELQSALRLVASVTCTVARCLGIVLPHTILLTPDDLTGDIADTVSEGAIRQKANETINSTGRSREQQEQPKTDLQSSTSSLYSLMDGSYWKKSAKKVAKSALARATGYQNHTTSNTATETSSSSSQRRNSDQHPNASCSHITPPSLDTSQVSIRIHHATAAVIAEDNTNSVKSSKYALSADVMNQQEFAIALQLLQNNVIVLCIRAGVPVSKLWPAEAMLLNLYALDGYIQQQITSTVTF